MEHSKANSDAEQRVLQNSNNATTRNQPISSHMHASLQQVLGFIDRITGDTFLLPTHYISSIILHPLSFVNCLMQWRSQRLCVGGQTRVPSVGGRGAKWGGDWGRVSTPSQLGGLGASWSPPVASGALQTHFLHIWGHRMLLVERKMRFLPNVSAWAYYKWLNNVLKDSD